MTLPVGTAMAADALRRRHDALLAELRDVEHWRRLVVARLDLAVAAVTSIDELALRAAGEPSCLPFGLRDLVGLPACDQALPEAGALVRLRAVVRDLDAYAAELRAVLRTAGSHGDDAGPDPHDKQGDAARRAAMAAHPSSGRTTRPPAAVLPFRQRGDGAGRPGTP